MTENKRFHYQLDEVGVFYYICDGGKTEDKIFAEVVGDVEEVTAKLNKLNEENKELKDKLFEAEKTLLIETADISDYAFDNVEKDIEELRKEIYGEGDLND